MRSIFLGLLTAAGLLMTVMSCSTAKKAVAVYSIYDITLVDSLDSKYIEAAYIRYNPLDISTTGRVDNEYKVKFDIDQTGQHNLLMEMADDENIVNIAASSAITEKGIPVEK